MKLFATLLCMLIAGAVHAQTTSNQSPAPGTLFYAEDLPKIAKWILLRTNTLSIDAKVAEMQKGGLTHQKYLAVFNTQGALVYQHELSGQDVSKWNIPGRDTGWQIVPYQIQLMEGGRKRISFSGAGLRNLNNLAKKDPSGIFDSNDFTFASVVNELDFASFTWDNNLTFQKTKSFDVDLVKLGMRLGLVGDDQGTFIGLRAGGALGFAKIESDAGRLILKGNNVAGKAEWTGGLEINIQHQNRNRPRINIQSNYVNGVYGYMNAIDTDVVAINKKNQAGYEQGVANYNNYISAATAYLYEVRPDVNWKDAYHTTIEQYYESYTTANHVEAMKNPGMPKESSELNDEAQVRRIYSYLKNSIDISMPFNRKGQPLRIGVGGELNIPISDRLVGEDRWDRDLKVDMTHLYNLRFSGKVYLKF